METKVNRYYGNEPVITGSRDHELAPLYKDVQKPHKSVPPAEQEAKLQHRKTTKKKGTRKDLYRRVRCTDMATGEVQEFESVGEAVKFAGVAKSTMSRWLKQPSFKEGEHWEKV